MKTLLARFAASSIIIKALVICTLIAVVYIGVFEPTLAFADRWNRRATELESAMARDKELAGLDGDGYRIQAAQSAFGEPVRPGQKDITPEGLLRVVNAVLDQHGVGGRTVSESSSALTGDAAVALGAGEIRRFILQVSFEADSATVAAVLADLEKAPEVAAVSRVRIDKASVRFGSVDDESGNGGLVRATLSPEAWIVSRSTSGGRAGS